MDVDGAVLRQQLGEASAQRGLPGADIPEDHAQAALEADGDPKAVQRGPVSGGEEEELRIGAGGKRFFL